MHPQPSLSRPGLPRVARVALAALVAAGASSGCSYPFSFDATGSLRLPLGVVTDCAGTAAATIPEDGRPDEDGNLTRTTQRLDGTVCHLHAEWTGPLVDVAEVRADAEAEMRDNGLDPEDVAVRIASIAPDVTAAGLSGRDGATLTRGVSYTGAVFVAAGGPGVEDDERLLDLESAGDLEEPEVTVHESDALLGIANDAWESGEPILGSGVADVAVDLAALAESDLEELPRRPSLRIRFVITLEGEAALD